MAGLRRFLIIGGIILLITMLVGFFLPGKISIAKTVIISGETDCPARIISDFGQWNKWLPVLKENLGKQQILSDNNCRIITEAGGEINFQFLKRNADSVVVLMSSASASPVRWQFVILQRDNGQGRLNLIVNTDLKWYPWERIKGIFLDKIAGDQYQEAIDNIAACCR